MHAKTAQLWEKILSVFASVWTGTSPAKEFVLVNRTYFLLLLPLKNPTLLQHLYSEIQLSSSTLRRNGKELYYKTQFVKCQVPWTPEVHESINHWLFSPLFLQLDYNTCNVAENKTKSSIFLNVTAAAGTVHLKHPLKKVSVLYRANLFRWGQHGCGKGFW